MYESVHNYQEEPYRIPIPGIPVFPGFRSCDNSAGNGLPGWVGFGRCFWYFRKLDQRGGRNPSQDVTISRIFSGIMKNLLAVANEKYHFAKLHHVETLIDFSLISGSCEVAVYVNLHEREQIYIWKIIISAVVSKKTHGYTLRQSNKTIRMSMLVSGSENDLHFCWWVLIV